MVQENNGKLIALIKMKFYHTGFYWGTLQIFISIMRRAYWVACTFWYRHVLGGLGRKSIVQGRIMLMYPKKIFIGDNCLIGQGCIFTSENPEGSLTIENNVSLVEECRIDFSGDIFISQEAHISRRTQIITHNHKYDPHSKPLFCSLKIGRKSWLGNDSIILPAVNTIGDFAIIGAGAVVTHDVPDKAIFAGNPANLIKNRETI